MKHLRLALVGLLVVGACADTPTDVERFDSQMAVQTWGEDVGAVSTVFPSTNLLNGTHSPAWANVYFLDAFVGEVTLQFTQPQSFAACFEYRVDDSAPSGDANFNPGVTDGLWPYTCQNASNEALVLKARQYVDVRMAFGAESDERFDWTRFYVPTKAESLAMCKVDPGWDELGFNNMGQCVRWAETGYDGR